MHFTFLFRRFVLLLALTLRKDDFQIDSLIKFLKCISYKERGSFCRKNVMPQNTWLFQNVCSAFRIEPDKRRLLQQRYSQSVGIFYCGSDQCRTRSFRHTQLTAFSMLQKLCHSKLVPLACVWIALLMLRSFEKLCQSKLVLCFLYVNDAVNVFKSVVQVLGQTDASSLQEIDSLLGLPSSTAPQDEQMAIDAIQEALMREVNTSVNTAPSTMNTRPALSAALMPSSQVKCFARPPSEIQVFNH